MSDDEAPSKVPGQRTRKRSVLAIAALVVAAVCLPVIASCTPPEDTPPKVNLLTNPGFERGTDDPDGWERDVFQPVSELTWDDEVHRSGTRSIAIHSPTPNDARWIQTVTVEPHTIYELSGWIRTEGVQHSPQAVDAGANLTVMGTWERSEALIGTNDWTFRTLRFNSGDSTTVTVGARLGFWSGTTAGSAWFDDLRLAPMTGPLPARWRMLVLIYDRTDLRYTDGSGTERHIVAQMTPEEVQRARTRAIRFATEDIPALTRGSMVPTVTVRTPTRTLDTLTRMGTGWSPSPADTAPERDPAFDAVIVIWDPRGVDLATGQPQWIGAAAGLTHHMGTGQTYAAIIAEAAVDYPHRNVFKHEFGHSILFYFDALGVTPLPTVSNHADAGDYVNCKGGPPYVWLDELEDEPIPNSIYNNHSGFTHDYYSGTIATADEPTRCLGITPQAWSHGGPVTGTATG